ncbi:hypothetical protein B1R94_12890 [Mycolicibacterium litorale]|nr:hypothetical protein B1R94_12890 [Mycolicibacterium litorale]
MSGVGKSTALARLALRGFATVDTDTGPWIRDVDGEPLWDEPLIEQLLAAPRRSPLFVQATVANQGRFYDRFAAVVLLSAPPPVLFARLAARTTNPFGKSEVDRRRIAADIVEVEPLLRSAATHEIDTDCPVTDVVDALVGIARDVRRSGRGC